MLAPVVIKPKVSNNAKLTMGNIDLSYLGPLTSVDFEPEVLDHSTYIIAPQHWNIMDDAKVIVKPVVGPNATLKYHLILTDQHGKV